jgi:hypothetical protein
MNQPRSLWAFLLCLALVLVLTGSVAPVSADRPVPDGEDAEVHPESVVIVEDLPANGPPTPDEEKEKPHRAPDSETLNGTKAAYHAGHHPEASPGPSVLASTRTTAIVAGSGAFVGLRRSESGGWLPPDTQLAVSASYVFEVVNLEGAHLDEGRGAAQDLLSEQLLRTVRSQPQRSEDPLRNSFQVPKLLNRRATSVPSPSSRVASGSTAGSAHPDVSPG